MAPLIPAAVQDSVEKFLDVPYDQRWEPLKPIIVQFYMEDNNTLAELSQRMKDEYSFDAYVHQYRYQLDNWGIKKTTRAAEKEAAISALGKRRLRDGTSTSDTLANRGDFQNPMYRKQLKRYMNQSIRQREQLTWSPGLFLRHDLPYVALFRDYGGNNSPSPSVVVGPTALNHMKVKSPKGSESSSTPRNAKPSITELAKENVLYKRAKLFLARHERELLNDLNRDETKSIVTWLHDFWVYAFMTTKYWGIGPKTWTFSLINFKSFARHPIQSTPDHHIALGETPESFSPTEIIPLFDSPTQLCRWSIHYREDESQKTSPCPPQSFDKPEACFGIDEKIPPSPQSFDEPEAQSDIDKETSPSLPQSSDKPEAHFDVDDGSTWTKWSTDELSIDLTNAIEKGLQQNKFSDVQPGSLPLDVNSIVKTVERSPREFKAEVFSFAIISRNIDKVLEMALDRDNRCYSAIFPFHLAAAHLDGSNTCCMVMNALTHILQGSMSLGVNYIDKNGLTVLDTLFVTIIRSHSTVPLQTLGNAFIGQTRYPGQEVDPCGRWDADSPCIRHLYASGEPAIPKKWKHMFCHTSVQSICHCITDMFGAGWRPDINTPSGLFLRRCGHCGLELKVGPLHALVLTAFCLANDGMPGENLFGIIACLVCLLTFRADPCATAKTPISMLLGHDPEDQCQHPEMNPAELALELSHANTRAWTPEISLGWEVLIAILQRLCKPARHKKEHENEKDNSVVCNHWVHELEAMKQLKLFHCGDPLLGTVWALIQAELLAYRRLGEDKPWLSPRFDMRTLLDVFRSGGDDYRKRLVDDVEEPGKSLLRSFSCCGLFHDVCNPMCARKEEACMPYYANLDDGDGWERTRIIHMMGWEP